MPEGRWTVPVNGKKSPVPKQRPKPASDSSKAPKGGSKNGK